MTDLSPVSVLTGPPQSASVDSSRLYDNSVIVDWHTYFFAAETTITQDHIVSATVLFEPPILSSSALIQYHNIVVSDLQSGQTFVSASNLTQNYNFIASNLQSGQIVVSEAVITENFSFEANNTVTGLPEVSLAPIAEAENFSAASVLVGLPDIGSSTLNQAHIFTPQGMLTRRTDVGSPTNPDAIIAQEIKEIEQMFGGWQRRTYEVPDGKLVQAEREIQNIFGDVVSIDKKAKSLIKFGKSAKLTANGTSTVWTVGGHESYVTGNFITHVSSSSASDVYEVFLECHTVTGTGYDAKFTFLTQTVTLQGQTKVALPFAVARVSQVNNNNGVELVGRVTVYEDTTVVGGVPSDPTKIHIDIPAGLQSSFKAATTLSDEDYYVLTGGFGSVSLKQAAAADFYLEVRLAGKVFVQKAAVSASSGGPWNIELDPAVIIPRNADIRITVETDTNNAVVFGVFKGYLAKVIG